jgi:hypothetical protein
MRSFFWSVSRYTVFPSGDIHVQMITRVASFFISQSFYGKYVPMVSIQIAGHQLTCTEKDCEVGVPGLGLHSDLKSNTNKMP